jgi:transcription initiation factor TFIIB
LFVLFFCFVFFVLFYITENKLKKKLKPEYVLIIKYNKNMSYEDSIVDKTEDDIWSVFEKARGESKFIKKIVVVEETQTLKNEKQDLNNPQCVNCPGIDLMQTDGQYVCPLCGIINDSVIDESPEWRYYGAEDNKSVNPTRCGMPTSEFYSEASLGSNISLNGASSYEMWKVAWYHNCNIMNYKERNFHEYITLMNNYASQADIPGCVIKEAENIYKSIIDYRASVNLHEFRHPTREAVLASCILEASRMNDCPRSATEMAEIFHIDRSVFVTGHKEFKKYWDVVQRQSQSMSGEDTKLSIPSDYINRFCSRLNLGNDFRKVCRQICDNISTKNIVPKYVAVSIVAGVIYLVNNLFNLGLKKRQISKVCDNVSEATIHKCYLDLNNSLEHIVPKYVIDEVIKKIIPK